MDLLLGIDAGTSIIKVVAFDLKGNQIAVAAKANHYEILPNGGVEQELDRTWIDTLEVIRQICDTWVWGFSVVSGGAPPDLAPRWYLGGFQRGVWWAPPDLAPR